MESETLYNDEAESYETCVVPQRFLNPAKELAVIVKELAVSNSGYYIDLGTGTGVVLLQLLECLKRDSKVFGLDISSEMLEVAKRKGAELLIKAELPTIPFMDKYFDIAVASFVISHLKNHHEFIEEVYRVLRPQGYFIFTTWGTGQTEYNVIWNDIVKGYLSDGEINKMINSYIPYEALFENRENVKALFKDSKLNLIKDFEKEYHVPLSMDEYLESRFSLLIGKHIKNVFNEKIWERFRQEVSKTFNEKIGDKITYRGRVNFFIFQKS